MNKIYDYFTKTKEQFYGRRVENGRSEEYALFMAHALKCFFDFELPLISFDIDEFNCIIVVGNINAVGSKEEIKVVKDIKWEIPNKLKLELQKHYPEYLI